MLGSPNESQVCVLCSRPGEALPGVGVVALVRVQRLVRGGRRHPDAASRGAPSAGRPALPGPAGEAMVRGPQRVPAEFLQLVMRSAETLAFKPFHQRESLPRLASPQSACMSSGRSLKSSFNYLTL